MELVKKASEPIIPRKRPSDDSGDHNRKKFLKHKHMVLAVRDYPPGCGYIEPDRKPMKKLKDVHSNLPKMTVEKPNEYRKTKPSFGPNPAGKVNFSAPNRIKEHQPEPKVTTTVVSKGKPMNNLDNVDSNHRKLASNGEHKFVESKGKQLKNIDGVDPNLRKLTSNGEHKLVKSQPVDNNKPKGLEPGTKEHARREMIKEAINLFDQVYPKLYQDNKSKPKGEKIAHWRVPTEAANVVKQMMKWMEPKKSLGHICGVQIGDKFKYRAQLKMIGLHFQPQSGIDYTSIGGRNLALSIVDAHRYSNKTASIDTLVYCGQGGIKFLGRKLPPEDQKLERGNLALKNSMDKKTPVRVIRKLNELFVYDGLYVVNSYTQKRSEEGKVVFEFYLNRVPGQPPLLQMLNASS